ncbi:uncharacterized protein LOC113898430 isoform X4 [Bos indicus x Bos taurus]|uniref:uncharacterized protein LOC113898430 isoform X4 n=1 Tax=Bos indicus x Bos taurus TaxID=30522 RepID=UPI000D532932|nr:uncharacterized protein LOC113898430 isoform X4 [Bos indicus x Bos taurus]
MQEGSSIILEPPTGSASGMGARSWAPGCSKIIRLEKLTHWNLKHTWSRWLHPGLRSHSRVFETKVDSLPGEPSGKPGMSSYLQANKLISHSLMDAKK